MFFINLILVIIFFSFLSERFLTLENFASILTITAELGIVAIGVAFLMIAGEFDLSVGSVYAVAPMVLATLWEQGIDPFLGLILSLLISSSIGFINGYITLKTDIPSFLTTLGTMMFFRGVLLATTGGFPIYAKGTHLLFLLLNSRLFKDFRSSAIWLVIIAIIFTLILTKTRYGNWVFAVGGNKEAARAVGIPVKKVKLVNFVISGLLAGLAGIISFSRFKIVDPTLGEGLELEAIAAAVIGGCLLSGGHGSIVGTFVGTLLTASINTGLVLIGAPPYWYRAFIGLILVIATIINMLILKKVVLK